MTFEQALLAQHKTQTQNTEAAPFWEKTMKKEYFRNLYKPRKNVIRTTALSPKNNNKSYTHTKREPNPI